MDSLFLNSHDGDPMPEPPAAADSGACCGNGCAPCIFDLHDLAMDQYRQDLRAWQARRGSSALLAPA
ncbi:oxidoreductase-like domain-containing protein [Roseateles sp.]|uniref:oxidoreductase-like domain-containing protein n=1 Tax=Roseateles sp. TaxID=1971397 RepID=UPI00286C33CE|nr:oxidoreductase-like domain-containing protein [Roseateles sp.]